MKTTITGTTKLEERFARRAQELKQKEIKMQIYVPPGYEWWFYQEYGTAVRGDRPYASGDTFDIVPKSGETLRFEGTGGDFVFPKEITDHEGIYPKRYIRGIQREIRAEQKKFIRELISSGKLTKENIRQTIRQAMRATKAMIVASMARSLTGASPEGKLGGEFAADVFDRVARIKDVGEEVA
jgi:hypothetical protein